MNRLNKKKPLTAMGDPDILLDCRCLSSPIPMIRFRCLMSKLAVNQVLTLLVSDLASKEYVPRWCKQTGNEHLEIPCKCGTSMFFVRRQDKLN